MDDLKGITKNTTKRPLGRSVRYSIGAWNVRYWLTRLEYACERNRVSFRRISPVNTSRTCPVCGHCHKGNRNGLLFKCLKCGYMENSDINAGDNIVNRFLNSKYGKGASRLPDRSSSIHYNRMSRSTSNQSDITTFPLRNGQVRENTETIPEFAAPVTNPKSKFF